MAFFPDDETVKNTTPTPADYLCADRLRELVTLKASRVRRWRRAAWADEFRILRQEIMAAAPNDKFVQGFPELAGKAVQERVASVLRWYCDAYGNPGVPLIQSATAFRKHFDWLERLLKRGTDDRPTASESAQATAVRLYAMFRGRTWGKGGHGLEASILRSCVAHETILARLRPLRDTPAHGPFVRWVWGRAAGDSFLMNWYENVWKQVVNWKEWSGTFKAFDLAPDSSALAALMTGWATEYGDARFWHKVRPLIISEDEA